MFSFMDVSEEVFWLQLKGFSGVASLSCSYLQHMDIYDEALDTLCDYTSHFYTSNKRVLPVRKQVLHHSRETAVKMCDTSRREPR